MEPYISALAPVIFAGAIGCKLWFLSRRESEPAKAIYQSASYLTIVVGFSASMVAIAAGF